MSSIRLVIMAWIVLINSVSCFREALFRKRDGVYFANRAMITKRANNEMECCDYCLREKSCTSINYKSTGDEKGLCELNNESLKDIPENRFENSEFRYLEKVNIKSYENIACAQNKEPRNKRSCKELVETDATLRSGKYYLQGNTSDVQYSVYCHMNENIPGCRGKGWTLVMKIDGRKTTFGFYSPYWTNKKSYAIKDGLEGLTEKESKLVSYWNTPFKKICLGMTVNGERRWMMLEYEASSLYNLIADGQYRNTTVGRYAWNSLIANSSLPTNGKWEGFGVFGGRKIKARVGSCSLSNFGWRSESCIGFGLTNTGTACSKISAITRGPFACCGVVYRNVISCLFKTTPAFGYILVQ